MEPIESSETSAYNNTLTPGTYPKEKKLQDNFFQKSVKRAKLIVTFAPKAIKPKLGCIILTHNVLFWTEIKFKKAIYSCSFQWCTCSLNICIGTTLINVKLLRSCYFSQVHSWPPSLWRRCGVPGRLQMQSVITNIHCPVFPACYICYVSLHTSHQLIKAVCTYYPPGYLPLKYFNSKFQWTIVTMKIKCSHFFLIGVAALNK